MESNVIKKLLFAIAAIIATMGIAFAEVDVNKADAAALDSIKGVGPKMSAAILAERGKGPFKDWNDFQTRVKGVGDKNAAKLSANGLTVAGKAKDGAPTGAAVKPVKAPAKPADKAAAPAKI
jgi:competence protein ComEA